MKNIGGLFLTLIGIAVALLLALAFVPGLQPVIQLVLLGLVVVCVVMAVIFLVKGIDFGSFGSTSIPKLPKK